MATGRSIGYDVNAPVAANEKVNAPEPEHANANANAPGNAPGNVHVNAHAHVPVPVQFPGNGCLRRGVAGRMRFLGRLNRLALGAVAVLWLAGCASGRSKLEFVGPDDLMDRGLKAYRERDWDEAIRAFQRFTLEYPGNARLQEARYRLADSYFGKKEYVTAASEFGLLAQDFPAGPYADDARFKVCEAYYKLSPRPELDQEYTRAAIEHCESMLAYYPTSEFAPRARELLAELNGKLARKVLLGGEFYYKRKAYDSAIIYYDDVLARYPNTESAPKALLRLVQIYGQLGYEEEEAAARERLLREYPGTAEARLVQQQAPATESG